MARRSMRRPAVRPRSESSSSASSSSESSEPVWIKNGSKVIGVEVDSVKLMIGDAVLVLSGQSHNYIALIYDFKETKREKFLKNMWLMTYHDPAFTSKNRPADMHEREVYFTSSCGEISVHSVIEKANIMSYGDFTAKMGTNTRSANYKRNKNCFFCRHGLQPRRLSLTGSIDWNREYLNQPDRVSAMDKLVMRIENFGKAPITSKRTSKDAKFGLASSRQLKRAANRDRKTRVKEALSDSGSSESDADSAVDESYESPADQSSESDGDDEDAKSTSDEEFESGAAARSKALSTPRKKFKTLKGTPRSASRKIYTPMDVTPLPLRVLPEMNSPYQRARAMLHVSAVLASLPCRDKEFRVIYDQIEQAIIDVTGICVYVSGTPGTGKTATVRRIIGSLQAKVDAGELDSFTFVEINGMKIADPARAYSLLWEAITEQKTSPNQALIYLHQLFSHPSPSRVPIVVFMDELDQLVTKDQKVMYNFFNWPSLPQSQLIMVTCANTMDLPERMLSNRISSRMGLARVGFEPYTFQQLTTIIRSRLESENVAVLEDSAIEFCARKVASVTGDARRALDVCRRSVQIVEQEAADAEDILLTPSKRRKLGSDKIAGPLVKKVTLENMRKAFSEMMASPVQAYVKSLPFGSKLVLAALVNRIRISGFADGNSCGDCLDEAESILRSSSLDSKKTFLVDEQDTLISWEPSLRLLLDSGIIILEKHKQGLHHRKVKLGIPEADVHLALQEVSGLSGL